MTVQAPSTRPSLITGWMELRFVDASAPQVGHNLHASEELILQI